MCEEFLDGWCHDLVAHDLAKVMSRYSDRYRDSGLRKKAHRGVLQTGPRRDNVARGGYHRVRPRGRQGLPRGIRHRQRDSEVPLRGCRGGRGHHQRERRMEILRQPAGTCSCWIFPKIGGRQSNSRKAFVLAHPVVAVSMRNAQFFVRLATTDL